MISFLLESDIAELRNQLVIESEGKMTYDLLKDAFEPDIKNRVKGNTKYSQSRDMFDIGNSHGTMRIYTNYC